MPLDDAQRPSRKPPEPRKRKGREPEKADIPELPPCTYDRPPREFYSDDAVRRALNVAWWQLAHSSDPRTKLEAVKVGMERSYGKARVAEPEPAGAPVKVAGDLGQAQDRLEKLLATMVGDLEQRIARGFNGPALVKEAREAAEVLQQLLARRRDAAKAAGLEGASAADLVATLAEQMTPADLSMLRERLAQVAGAKEAMQ